MAFLWKLWSDRRGQDLIEYALLIAFAATSAGVLMPSVSGQIGTIFSKVGSVVQLAAGGHPTDSD